jgi:hypothetical protein
MRYYKVIENDYILLIGIGEGGEEITEAEYSSIMGIIRNRPTAQEGYGYRLTAELEWKLYELPPVEEAEEATAEDYEAALAEMGVEV